MTGLQLDPQSSSTGAPESPGAGMESRAWTWVAVSFLGFVLAEIATIPVILLIEGTFGLSHAVGLASWTISRVLLAGLVTLVLGRILLSPRPRTNTAALLVLGLGAGLPAVVWVALVGWAADDRGYFEPSDLAPALCRIAPARARRARWRPEGARRD